ncbi:hypothetical protein B0H16DRAFT_1510560 [Mycena metata]|uniref:MYND-type domain-containing protein n=1 Tax=Mycena metata TaxID=1033252 RepID=A0AAD7JXN1_9AGAR|nr:hypothetical protein B0H16DRAFT_1510560 [Mycena metata]
MRQSLRSLATLQDELRVMAVTSFLQPEFCWKKLSHSARETYMLEGLYRTCFTGPTTRPPHRMFTCDVTLSSLQDGNGEGFLTLLRRYIPTDDASSTNGVPMSYLHPQWTAAKIQELNDGGYKKDVQGFTMWRDQFLTEFLYFTVLSVFGAPRAPEMLVKKRNGPTSTVADGRAFDLKKLSNAKKVQRGEAPVYRLGNMCEGCKAGERGGERFSICQACNRKMDRKVHYCSRECQVSDWPNHKNICGKKLTHELLEEKVASTEIADADNVLMLRTIGPAKDGYQRSPALERQIQFLNMFPADDYVFFSDSGPHRFRLYGSPFILRMVFRPHLPNRDGHRR